VAWFCEGEDDDACGADDWDFGFSVWVRGALLATGVEAAAPSFSSAS